MGRTIKTVLPGLLVGMAALLCTRCTGPTKPDHAGTATETENVVGKLFQPDGITPAAGVHVFIRPKKSLADTTGAGIPKRMAAVDSVITDTAGRFAFDTTLDTGTYVIAAASGNDAVLIDSVAVTSHDSTDSLPPDTLKPAGALKGVIGLSEGGDPRKVFVLAFGIDRFAHVNADGSFRFAGLAEAKYDLRLISSLDNYGVLDTTAVPVRSADTTDLDTIELPFMGIPTPKNVTITYDTLQQIVTLTWSKEDTSLAKGFNVFRRKGTSGQFAVANKSLVADTVFVDSLSNGLGKGETYQYYIVALDKNNNPGQNSPSVTAIIAYYVDAGRDTTFQVGDSVKLKGQVNTNAIAPAEYRWDANGDGTNEFASATVDLTAWFYSDTGTYKAVFSVKSLENRIYTDTVRIRIIPKDTTGAPSAPRNVRLSYDTLKQIVTLTWSPNFESDVMGYNVYRRDLDSSFGQTPINGTLLLIDTVYRDSTGIQDQSYEYKVVALDKGDNAGKMSAGDSVLIASAFFASDSVILKHSFLNEPHSFAVSSNLRFFVPVGSGSATNITIFSQAGDSVGVLASDSFVNIAQVGIDSEGSIYALEQSKDRVYIFGSAGNLRSWFGILPSATKMALGANGSTYIAHYGSAIVRYDSTGNIVDSLSYAADDQGKMLVSISGKIYDSHYSDRSITVFDTALSAHAVTLNLSYGGKDCYLVQTVDSVGNLYVLYREDVSAGVHVSRIFVFKTTGELVGSWGHFFFSNYNGGIMDMKIIGRKAYILIDTKPTIKILSFTLPNSL